jgi:zinc/manganese transport system permease protein
LFGSMFVITPSTVPALIVSALLALAVVVALARVLLLTSLSPDIAAARGVPVRATAGREAHRGVPGGRPPGLAQ